MDPAQSNNASDATGSNPFMINKASVPKVDGEIKVSFVNSPPGMRVMETRSSGLMSAMMLAIRGSGSVQND